jgi:hypothetical protein
MCSENLNIFVKLFSLLYADDTIILSETEADMQYALAIFEEYCHHWKLKVNFSGHPLVGNVSEAHHCLASRSAYQTMTDKYRNI